MAVEIAEDGFIRERQLLKLLSISRSTLWRGVKSGSIPKPYKLGQRTIVWKVAEIRALIANLGQ